MGSYSDSMGFYSDSMGFNGILMGSYSDSMGYSWDIPPGKRLHNELENHRFQWENPL